MRALLLALVLGASTFACSSSDSTGTTAESDTGTPADSSTTSDGSAEDTSVAVDTGVADTVVKADSPAGCNMVDNVADVVTTTRVAEALPTLPGGTVADGTYVVTAVTEYTGTGGATGPVAGDTMKQTMRLAAGKFEIVRVQKTNPEKRSAGDFKTSGTTFTMTGACPTASGDVPVNYEATGTTLKISLGTTLKTVITYTKK